MQDQTRQIIRQILNSWRAQNKVVTDFFNKYDDDYYLQEVAPGRNRAIYLLGHLIAMNDGMFPLFDIGERLFPELEPVFIVSADRSVAPLPAIGELRNKWTVLNETLTDVFDKMDADEWLERHAKISEIGFSKDPMRNRLNVLIGRMNHQSHHIGQLIFLVPRD